MIPTNEFFEDTFRKVGYTLTGWEGYTEGMTMPAKPLTFVAQYKVNKYALTVLDLNGATLFEGDVEF